MDGQDSTGTKATNGVIVMAATNRPNSIDDALRRPGRFDREIEIGIPDQFARLDIINALLQTVPHSLTPAQIAEISSSAHGFVGADLAAIVREAGLRALKRLTTTKTPAASTTEINPPSLLQIDEKQEIALSYDDMRGATASVKPSSMREVSLEVPNVRWSDIGGQEDVKARIREAVEWPLKHPEAFERFKIRPPKGILMYGPPGCSKTLMAKALATEAGLNFLAVKGPEDEIDAIAVRRGNDAGSSSVSDRVLSQLLNEMDGIEALVNVTVIAATNRPDILDSALLRPGRMDRILYVSPPDYASRLSIFKIKTLKMACTDDTDGYSGAEVVSVCQEAAMMAIEEDENILTVSQRHFEAAINQVTPRITAEMISFYDGFRQKSGLRSI
ncbi:spermatogenesis associated protein 5 [Physocladia obscura]|uniref:Spermatogenesis associated protein 5 n=1 Tax=Physocladia obscura TaxID=109957 RepID=A0AAD5XFI4_9FUNG|nr:spermatogenesis associated protein 5 [Physocladia obscura]